MDEVLRLEFKAEIETFAQKLRAYSQGQVEKKEYKGFSGGFGSYAQRSGGHMLRLRMTGGQLTMDRLGFIADCVERYQIKRLKLTTCQTIQLHDLDDTAVVAIMEAALDHDIATRGGGGDFPRNVMVSPLSGTEPGESFDVLPAAMAAGDYLLSQIKTLHLPRKLKVGFCNNAANATHVTFRDLGFVAKNDGTFDVYCAGGLGPNPKMGVLVDSGVKPEEILYDICAMLRTFAAHGNYENRAKARTRYLQDSLGADGLKREFEKHLTEAHSEGRLQLTLAQTAVDKQGDGVLDGPRVIAQKQAGLYAVSYHPLGGLLDSALPRRLYELTRSMPCVQWRVGPDETMYCINLTAREAQSVLDATADGAETLFERSVACIGASVCQQGVRDSQAALGAIVEAARKEKFADGVLPRVRISGCPSSCGAHQAGTLGFQGGVKLVDKVPMPAYTLLVNGSEALGQECFGAQAGVLLEQDLPAFIIELGRMVSGAGAGFEQWFPGHREEFDALVSKYTA